jgi:hypothetical protein
MDTHEDIGAQPKVATVEQRIDIAQHEIEQILRQYRCRIVPYMNAERVGEGPLQRLLVETKWAIVPTGE